MELKQRSNDWRRLRIGDVTASRFHDVLAEPSGKDVFSVKGGNGNWWIEADGLTTCSFRTKTDCQATRRELVDEWRKTHWSATAESYLNEKLAELIHCVPADTWRSDATDWGLVNEPYAFEAAIPVIEQVFEKPLLLPEGEYAYIHHATEPHIGCSPDGIIGDDGLLELKCPYNGARWITAKRFGLTVPPEYMPQIQGQMWVANRQWCAFCYFDPRVAASGLEPLLFTRVIRDDKYIDNILAPRVIAFRDYLRAEYQRLIGENQ